MMPAAQLLNRRACGNQPLVAHPGNYDIAPVIVAPTPSGPARIFWGGSHDPHAGDHIFSATAPHFCGPYTAPALQLAPWGPGQEKVHVDDPSVVQPSAGIEFDPRWLGGQTTKTRRAGVVRKPNGCIYNEGRSEGRPFVSVDLATSFWQASAWSPDKGWEDGQKFLTSDIFWSGADVWTARNGAQR